MLTRPQVGSTIAGLNPRVKLVRFMDPVTKMHQSTPVAPRPSQQPSLRAAALRLILQGRQRSNLRRHFLRSVVRTAVLAAGDIAVLLLVVGIGGVLVSAPPPLGSLGAILALRGAAGQLLHPVPLAAALVIGLAVTGNYGPGDRRRDPGTLLYGTVLALGLSTWFEFWNVASPSMVLEFAILSLSVWLGLYVGGIAIERVVSRVKRTEATLSYAVLVGTAEECASTDLVRALKQEGEIYPVGFIDGADTPHRDALGSVRNLSVILSSLTVDTVIVCGYLPDDVFERVIDLSFAAHCRVLALPKALQANALKPKFITAGGRPFIELSATSLAAWQLVLKRAMDILVALTGLLVLAPVFAVTALAIRVDSRGPVLFRQTRVGRAGRPFRIYKFRSMVVTAEEQCDALRQASVYDDHRLFKVEQDPRVTRVGAWLRKTSLDELPQLVNVLMGDMSLVGPRPPLPEEVVLYEERHFCRFDVKPGITGPWQVSGRNLVRDFEQVVALERDYVRKWSFWKDLVILMKTVPVVLGMRGAH